MLCAMVCGFGFGSNCNPERPLDITCSQFELCPTLISTFLSSPYISPMQTLHGHSKGAQFHPVRNQHGTNKALFPPDSRLHTSLSGVPGSLGIAPGPHNIGFLPQTLDYVGRCFAPKPENPKPCYLGGPDQSFSACKTSKPSDLRLRKRP